MEERKISELESLQLIREMIYVAKQEHHEKGEGWLIWGWLLFVASVSSALFSFFGMPNLIGWVWTAMLVIGLLIGLWTYLSKRRTVPTSKTYVQELLDKLSAGFFISLLALISASFLSSSNFAFGYYYVLYAFWMFIYGSVLQFRPLLTGAVVNWIAAILIFIIQDFMFDMIVSAIAIAIGYLIPGYILRAEYKKKLNSKRNQTDGF